MSYVGLQRTATTEILNIAGTPLTNTFLGASEKGIFSEKGSFLSNSVSWFSGLT